MRGVLTKVLIFLGAFLLGVAALAMFYAPGQVKRTPLDTDSVTMLSGQAQIFDGKSLVSTPVSARSITKADSEASNGDVVVFQNSSCLVKDPQGDAPDCATDGVPAAGLITAGTDVFAVDRRTALAVTDYAKVPADAETKSGLVNKFPFDVERKSYPFWDSYIKQPVDAQFAGVETINGLETYKFTYAVTDTAIKISGADGLYATDKTMWIDPVTGAIQDQQQTIVQKMAVDSQTVIDLDFKFTDETVAANVAAAKENADQLRLLTSTVPKAAGLLGLIALVGGVFLFLRGREARVEPDTTRAYVETSADDVFGPEDGEATSRRDLPRR